MASASAAGPLATSYVETLIIDAKMFENYGLEGGLGSSWEWSCMSGRRLWSQNLAERAQNWKFDELFRVTWEQVAPQDG